VPAAEERRPAAAVTVPEEQPDATSVLLPGPWAHRDVSANGVRLHAAEAGSGPLVLLLHGFPQFWWSWRHQLTGLAAAGLRVVAPDLRGYGASDKPPRGYDLPTAAADAAAVVRALGEEEAVVVGADWGGLVAWTMAALHPRSVRSLVVVSAAHPRRLRSSVSDPRQRRALAYALPFQLPRLPERRLTRPDDDPVAELMRRWAGPSWVHTVDFAEAVSRYRSASRIPQAAYGAMEYYRWAGRSQLRPDGWRFARRMAAPVTAPTLQLHGALDRAVLPSTARGSGRYVAGAYEWRELPGVGHFPHEEAPDEVTAAIAAWAR
jgi:pimeloyl-ACP methyl ester carboxylesterase